MNLLSKIKEMRTPRQGSADEPQSFDIDDLMAQDTPRSADLGAATLSPSFQPSGLSVISESAPSEFPADYNDTRLKSDFDHQDDKTRPEVDTGLPFIGHLPLERQQKMLFAGVALGILGLILSSFLAVNTANRRAAQASAVGESLTQSQRLAKSLTQALLGREQAFVEVSESVKILASSARGLQQGDASMGISAASDSAQQLLAPLMPMIDRAEKNAKLVISEKATLTKVSQALRDVNAASADLLELAEGIATTRIDKGQASPAELTVLNQLVMLTQRIGKSANEFLTIEGVSTEAVFLLGKDLNAFKELAEGLSKGSANLGIQASTDPAVKEQLEVLLKVFEDTRVQSSFILNSLEKLVGARDAEVTIVTDSEPLRKGLEQVRADMARGAGIGGWNVALLTMFLALSAAAGYGLLRMNLAEQRLRTKVAEFDLKQAESQELEAKRVNDANQAAILRLMNELQSVAEGDLTQQATVTEDITGAIADSVNFTVEELRTLVAQVQGTVLRVTDSTGQIDATSTELMAASTEQLREIRETGESVLNMAGRIRDVSGRAQESAQVARQSVEAADSGLRAVQNAIGGMQTIREQIQETSKRIKRLGESSQEIGEITELISDITEQTNVLALNAAIQAASAGDAGRGFSVVAEEVQRLAERSADATRQIAALVRTIQTDTQEAVGAMERSTQKVVEGAKLSDTAGAALNDIDRVSRRLADLIEAISSQATQEANSANVVVANIQHIFAVTEQTGDGTRSTAQLVRELSKTAEELQQSVARFKIA
jgi:twitching motility protein PilJ